MKIFIQVDVNSPDDYPKEKGMYFCNRSGFMTVANLIPDNGRKTYMREIKYWLLPAGLILGKDTKDNDFVRDLCYNYPTLAKAFIKHLKEEQKKMNEILDFLSKQKP